MNGWTARGRRGLNNRLDRRGRERRIRFGGGEPTSCAFNHQQQQRGSHQEKDPTSCHHSLHYADAHNHHPWIVEGWVDCWHNRCQQAVRDGPWGAQYKLRESTQINAVKARQILRRQLQPCHDRLRTLGIALQGNPPPPNVQENLVRPGFSTSRKLLFAKGFDALGRPSAARPLSCSPTSAHPRWKSPIASISTNASGRQLSKPLVCHSVPTEFPGGDHKEKKCPSSP